MSSQNKKVRGFRNATILRTSLFITIIHLGVYLFSDSNRLLIAIIWVISLFGVILIISRASQQVVKLWDRHQNQLEKSKRQSQCQTALAALSAGFATTLLEDEICQELANRLYEIQCYEYVAVYLVEDCSGNRILKASVGGLGLPDSTVINPGKGLSSKAIEQKTLQYTSDVSLESSYIPGIGHGSEVDVPIQFDKEILGVLIVETTDIDAYGPDDFSLLSTAADQAALAILNTRLLASEKQRRHEAEILRKATMALSSELELDHVLNRILTQLGEVVPFDSACIFLKQGSDLIAMASKGLPQPDEVIGNTFPADDELFHKVLSDNKPDIIENIPDTTHFMGWGGTHEMQAWMGIPLNVSNDVIGILTLDNKNAFAYDQEKANLALIFANQAAVAIQNAQLYDLAKSSADQLMILHQASQKITSSSFDPEKTYIAVHQAAKQLMPCEAFIISILNEEKDEIEGVYLYDKDGRTPPIHYPSDQGISGHIIKTGEPLLIHDYLESEVMAEIPVKHFGNPEHIRAFIAVPLRLGDITIGMLSSQSYLPHGYTKYDQQMLEMLAAHAAIAINNAYLFSQIQNLAITDSLTNVYNRRYFFETANKEFSRSLRFSSPLSIVMIDLDNYKEINDLYGHLIGDKAICVISNIIAENIRDSDVLGRYGGDEFSILLPETDLQQAIQLAERLKDLCSNNLVKVDHHNFFTTISAGVTCTNKNTKNFSELLLCADIALYDAKKSGRNQVKIREWPITKDNKR